MHPNTVNRDELELTIKDGVAVFRQLRRRSEPDSIPYDLIRNPPEWARILSDKGALVEEFVIALGTQARDAQSLDQRKEILDVFEQFALWEEGRRAAELILGPSFVGWLTSVISIRPLIWIPAIIVSANSNLQFPSAWLSPYQDEFVWPESELQLRNLDRQIAAVWQNNGLPLKRL